MTRYSPWAAGMSGECANRYTNRAYVFPETSDRPELGAEAVEHIHPGVRGLLQPLQQE